MTDGEKTEAAGPSPRPSLFRSTAIMTVGTLLSRVTGIGRTIAFAAAFGAVGFAGPYTLANQTPTAVYELIVGGILSATLIPVLVRLFAKEQDGEDPWLGVSAILTTVLVVVAGLAVALFIAAPWIIELSAVLNRQSSIEDQKEVATFLLRLFVPQVALYGFVSVATALLNAHRRFGPPMFAPICNNILLICLFLSALLFIDDRSLESMVEDRAALLFMGIGTTAGVASMALVLLPFVRAEAKGRLHWRWAPRHPAVRTLISLSGWTFGFVVANQVAYWLSVVLAYGKDGLAAYQYAYTFFILPHGIYAVSVMSALQPDFAEHWVTGKLDLLRERIASGLRLILFLIIPGAVGYALLAHPVVTVALERADFTSSDSTMTSSLLFWMVVGLPGFSAFLYLTRVFQAMQKAKVVFYLYVFENGVNIVAALALYPSMGLNAVGLGQSLGYGLGSIAALFALRHYTGGIRGRNLADGLLRIAFASLVMGAVVYGFEQIVPGAPIWRLLAAILAGGVAYFGTARLLRIEEMRFFLGRIVRTS